MRLAPLALVLALLVATAAAFAVSQRRKLEPIPVAGPRIAPAAFSPGCECPAPAARVRFRLNRADTVDVELVDEDGRVVRALERGRERARGELSFGWDGRDDDGAIVPDGTYSLRIRLREAGRTFETPASVAVDSTPPRATIVSARPRRFAVGHGRVLVGYRLSEPARPELLADGQRIVGPARARARGHLEWWGRIDGEAASPGRYAVTLVARDAAGNLSPPSRPVIVEILRERPR